MTSYLRNIFSGQPTTTSGSNGQNLRSRSCSAHRQNPNYIYAAPDATFPSTRSSTTPFSRYDLCSVRARNQGNSQQPLGRPPFLESSSDMMGKPLLPYPYYLPSLPASHSHSGSSIHPGSFAPGFPPIPSRTSSSSSLPYIKSDIGPTFKQGQARRGGINDHQSLGSFASPQRGLDLRMHPMLAYSRLHPAPVSYDISYSPSSRTVLDRGTYASVPTHTLSQPATEPPTFSRLVLKSDKFPWPIIVGPSKSEPQPGSRFYIGGPRCADAKVAKTPVTNLDILYAVHKMLAVRVTQKEWEALGHGSRSQRKVTRAYERRCIQMGGGWDSGVRRIDWLGGKTRLIGIEMDKNGVGDCIGNLIFGKA